MIRERENAALPGLPVLHRCASRSSWAQRLRRSSQARESRRPPRSSAWSLALVGSAFLAHGTLRRQPERGQGAAVLRQLRRHGEATPGLRWANPLYTKKRISLRIRNFESSHLKVNDNEGNPIEIAAVVVWRVVDTAEAVFEVDDYNNYVKVQTESALRNLATSYTYDAHDDEQMSLRGHTAAVAEHLKNEIQERLAQAGVEVIEARISHLAYAPEIAHAMLQRQQAGAIIAARQRIVEGAVGMVEMALDMLSRRDIVDARQRAQGGDGEQPAGRAVRRASRRSRSSMPARSISEAAVAERKPFLLRIDREVLDAVQRWADDDLRSLNGQIEFLLRRALKEGGTLRTEERPEGRSEALGLFVLGLLPAAAGASTDEALRDDRRAADRARAATAGSPALSGRPRP